MKPVRQALIARTVRLLEQLERDEYPEAAALLAEYRREQAEPEPLTNPGRESGAGGVPWRGESA